MVGKLLKRIEEVETTTKKGIRNPETPRLLPSKIQTPENGWSAYYFEEVTGYPFNRVNLWVQGRQRTLMEIPRNTEVSIEYLPRRACDIRPIKIEWPNQTECWLVNLTKFEEETQSILRTKEYKPENGYWGSKTEDEITQWPQNGIVQWIIRVQTRVSGTEDPQPAP
jgi:hypothetical protein